MKPSNALKPLAFAMAALLSVAASANGPGNNPPPPSNPPSYTLDPYAAAAAVVIDVQNSNHNKVTNKAIKNTATVKDSVKGAEGNMGVNAAAGSGNQQDNAVAIATSDESFVFGTAASLTSATQTNSHNNDHNYGTQNNALLKSSGNGSSGNVGINVAAGDFNQQKNNLAIAVSNGRIASAGATASQTSNNLSVINEAGASYLSNVNTWSQGPSWNNNHTPVVNNATMDHSFNGISGNGGANIAAGVGNQQSNSLSIAAGCKVCM
jgi:hypothetical protein